MCGIAGVLDLTGRKVEPDLLIPLASRLAHRGPDAEGYFLDGAVGLAQRRLSIIDLAGGRQPMSNEDGTVWVTFNGEVYNFQELRAWLESRGHRFASNSDTEVIVHAYEEEGAECPARFRGMFAFAVWDAARRQLFLARDRVGKKPLFYAEADGRFLFASELQAILAHPAVPRRADLSAVDEYLTYGYIPAPKTGFLGISKLLPGHSLTVRETPGGPTAWQVKTTRYWRPAYTPKLELDDEAASAELLELLREAVRLRLVADVPVGALLSGGIDSGLVVALMSQLAAGRVKTFSIGFDDQDYNELPYARLVARRYGTEHHEFVVRPNALEILPTLVRHYGEPFADSSAVPSFFVARLTRQHVKVVLNGDGGDECFGGYERYLGSLLATRYQKLPRFVRRGIVAPLARLIPEALPHHSRFRQAKRFFQKAELPTPRQYLGWMSYFSREEKERLYAPGFRHQLRGADGEAWLLDLFDRAGRESPDPLDTLLAVDVQSYLPYDLLVKMDIATMANSLEARSPLLDQRVMEFAARLPSRHKVRGRTLKYLLRRVAGDYLPPEILRRRKMGFGVPVGRWLREDLRPLVINTLLSTSSLARGYFEPQRLRELVDAHLNGTRDHASQLWALLCLELWHREFAP